MPETSDNNEFKEKQEIKDTGTYTFEKVANEWLGSRKGRSAEATIEDHRNKLDNQILPTFAKLPIKGITRPECIAFMRSHEKRALEIQNQNPSSPSLLSSVLDYQIFLILK